MPMFLLLIAGVLGVAYFKGSDKMGSRLYNLPDVDPPNQGGTYKRDYDITFLECADSTGVPFALLKAHAIAESSLNPNAYRDESSGKKERQGWASRGLMQILWWPNSGRFAKYGYQDSKLGVGGVVMFDPDVNVDIASKLIRDNLHACNGNLRDTINMYNTGKKEAQFKAPGDYVNKVLKYYSTLIRKEVL